MKTSSRYITACISIIIFLFACMIYICNRSFDMILYKWLNINTSNVIFSYLQQHAVPLPDWALYNLPDGLWLFSYTLLIDAIWSKNNIKYYFIGIITLLILILEIAQMMHIFPGTGDILDIASYLIALIIYSLYNIITYRYEKISKI